MNTSPFNNREAQVLHHMAMQQQVTSNSRFDQGAFNGFNHLSPTFQQPRPGLLGSGPGPNDLFMARPPDYPDQNYGAPYRKRQRSDEDVDGDQRSPEQARMNSMMMSRIASLLEQLNVERKNNKDLAMVASQQHKKQKEVLKNQKKDMAELRETNIGLREQIDKSDRQKNEDYEYFSKELEKLKNCTDVLRAENETVQKNNDVLKRESDGVKVENEGVKKENDSLKKEMEKMREEYTELQAEFEKLSAANCQNTKKTQSTDGLQKDVEALKKENGALKDKIEELRKVKRDGDEKFKAYEQRKCDEIKALRKEIEALKKDKSRIAILEEREQTLAKSLEEHKQERERDTALACAQNEKAKKMKQELENITQQLQQLNKEKEETQKVLEDTRKQVEDLDSQLSESVEQESSASKNLYQEHIKVDLLNRELEDMRKFLREAEAKKTPNENLGEEQLKLEEKIRKLVAEKAAVINRALHAEKQVMHFKTQCKNLYMQTQELQKKLQPFESKAGSSKSPSQPSA